jgi:hypothetical protein
MRQYLLAAALLVPAGLARAQTAPFEGIITYRIPSGDDEAATMRYYVKGSKVRVDMAGSGSASVIYDLQTGAVLALNHALHAYMAIDPTGVNPARLGGGMGPVAGMLSGLVADGSNQAPKRTGAHQVVAGVQCDDYAFHTDTVSIDLCNAPGMKAFPLMIRTSVNGVQGFEATATRVEQTALSPALFTIPPGYESLTGRDLNDLIGHARQPATSGDDDSQ